MAVGSAIRNGLWNGLGNVVAAVTGLVGSVVIVRSLSPDAYGAFSYYLWLAGILGTLGTLAFPESVTKIASELRGERKLIEAQALARWVTIGLFGLNLLVSLVVLVWALAAPPPERIYLVIVATFLAPSALVAVLRSTFWSHERYRPVTIAAAIASSVQLAMIVFVAEAGWGAPGFVAAMLSACVVQLLGLALALRRADLSIDIPFPLSLPSRSTVRRYFAFFLPATMGVPLAIVVWERSEVYFLARFSGLEQVGFYSLAYTIFSIALALGWALINGFYPAISHDYGAGEWHRIEEKVQHGLALATLYVVPLSFGGWATVEGVIELLYGSKMLPVAPLVRVLLLGLASGVIGGVLSVLVNATGRAWLNLKVGIGLCVLNILLDLVLIPPLGALGGAIANTTSQVAYTLLLFVIVARIYEIRVPWRSLVGIVAAGMVATFLVPESLEAWLPGITGLLSGIVLGAALYAAIVWFSGYLHVLQPAEVEVSV